MAYAAAGRGLLVILAASALAISACSTDGTWRTASRDSAGIAPTPEEEPDAVVQIYAAKVWGARGLFADHTWTSVKPRGADSYTVYEVIGWRKFRGRSVVRIAEDLPDRRWFGNEPRVLYELRGDAAQAAAEGIAEAAESYPYPDEYTAFPGPNSNTFTQWLVENVEELDFSLPIRAIGKNFG